MSHLRHRTFFFKIEKSYVPFAPPYNIIFVGIFLMRILLANVISFSKFLSQLNYLWKWAPGAFFFCKLRFL